ncbi:MAG: hypothetical protein IPG04_39045 [Polyangiaceae bacterium]|jgi:hypothetical protein|nr:hypothetical protein [Polyangiaceae bacterium]
MSLARSLVLALLGPIAIGVVALTASAEGEKVKEADATCMTATAILIPSDGADEPARVEMIRKVLAKNNKWSVVGEPPVNRVGEVAVVRYDVRHTYKGGPTVAYTVACGHGGTCNDVANEFRKEHPTLSPAPAVQCGDVSNVLINPQVMR